MNRGVQVLLPLLAMAVGFVAGTGFGLVVLSDDGGAPAEEPGAGRLDGARPSEPDRQHREAGGEHADDTSLTSRRRGVSTDGVMIENAMRGIVDLPTSGSGVISGTVSDDLGRPLAGVVVSASTSFWSVSETSAAKSGAGEGAEEIDDVEEEDSLDARVRQVVREYRFEEATRRRATTGPDGAYRLDGLVNGSFTLSPELAGYTFRTAAGADWSAGPGEVRDWIASPVVAVTILATLPDGTLPRTYHLNYQDFASNELFSEERTSSSDPLEVAPGEYEFTVLAGEFQRYCSEPQRAVVVAGTPTTVEVSLKERPGLMGQVTFGPEEPTLVGVAALRVGDGLAAEPENLMGSPHISWVPAPFEYALLDLPAGSYLIGATLRNGRVLESRTIEIADDLHVEDFAIVNVDVRDYTIVHVRGPDGQPVREATFSVGYSAGDASFEGSMNIERKPDGSFHVPHVLPGSPHTGYSGWSQSGETALAGDLAATSNFIVVSSPRFGRKRVEFEPLTQRELDVTFGEPAFALVTLAGHADSEWRGRVLASLRPALGPDGNPTADEYVSGEQKPMTPQGVSRVGPVGPGSYVVVLFINTAENGQREVATQDVTLGVGETSVTMTLPELHELVMECEGAALDLDLHRDPRIGQTADFLDEGVRDGQRTIFRAIVAGRYRVRAYGDGSPGEMLVDVPAIGPIVFRPRPYDSLRVDRVPEALGGQLLQGDEIIAIDGETMEGEHRIHAALALAHSSETVRLTVRRGGSSVEVTVAAAALADEPFTFWTRSGAR